MNKLQKIWLWVFIIMFAVPELLFNRVILFVLYLISRIDLSSIMFNIKISFLTEKTYTLIAITFEIIGLLGLLFSNIKLNKNKYKHILSLLITIMIIMTIFYFLFITSFTGMKFLG